MNGKIIVVFLLGLIAAVVGAILVVVGSNREDADVVQPSVHRPPSDQPTNDSADNPFIAPSILIVDLSDEDRGAVTELLINQEPQSLPPQESYRLPEGRHSIVIRRGIEQDSRTITLTEGQKTTFRPRWRLPRKVPSPVDLPALDPNFQATPSSTSP